MGIGFRIAFILGWAAVSTLAAVGQQQPNSLNDSPRKANARPIDVTNYAPEPFDTASVERMAAHCVTLETELGAIQIEMLPHSAPEAVRNFLNLAATGSLDTTTFSRIVKNFIIQGGNLSTSENWSTDLAKKMSRRLPDEPGLIRHVRGIVSMARTDEPNSATTHFFILVSEGSHLDAKFAAFGRVKSGMDIVDAINQAPAVAEKPERAIKIGRAVVSECAGLK